MQVTTAPLHNAAGEVIEGVEMFRDVSSMRVDFQRAKQIQSQLKLGLANDPLGRFTTFYTPFLEFLKFSVIVEIRHIL